MTESERDWTAVLLLITGVQSFDTLTIYLHVQTDTCLPRHRATYTSYEMHPSKFSEKSLTNGPKFRKLGKVSTSKVSGYTVSEATAQATLGDLKAFIKIFVLVYVVFAFFL